MHTAGGRVSTIINGIPYSARGEITLDVSAMEVEAGANQDGSVFRTVKPKPRNASLTFDRFVDLDGRVLQWSDNIMLLANIAFTFIEQDTNVTHLLTDGCFVGKPEHNLATGEVSGLSIAATKYQTIQ
jgi:hypothetical protein